MLNRPCRHHLAYNALYDANIILAQMILFEFGSLLPSDDEMRLNDFLRSSDLLGLSAVCWFISAGLFCFVIFIKGSLKINHSLSLNGGSCQMIFGRWRLVCLSFTKLTYADSIQTGIKSFLVYIIKVNERSWVWWNNEKIWANLQNEKDLPFSCRREWLECLFIAKWILSPNTLWAWINLWLMVDKLPAWLKCGVN